MSSYSDKTLKNKMLNNSNGKCGEITFCIQVGKRVYALNCLYCSQICLQWDMFINHMEQMHDAELNSEYPLHAENESELQISDCQGDFGRPSAVQHKVATNTEFNSTDTCHLDDPLEEDYYLNPSSIPVKVEEFDYTPNEIIMDDRGVTATNSQIDKELSDHEYGDDDNDNDDISSESSFSSDDNDGNEKIVYDKRVLTELIIKYYKEHPILWQTNKPMHKSAMKHHEAYKSITKLINKDMNLKFKCIQIKGKINKLRSKFRKEQQQITEFKVSKENYGDDDNDKEENDIESAVEAQPTSWLYENMSFLKDHINYERKRSKRVCQFNKNYKNKKIEMNLQNEIKSKTENYLKADLCVNFPSYPLIKNETGFSVNIDDSLCNFGSNTLVKDPDESEKNLVKMEPYVMQPDLTTQGKFSFPRKEIQRNRNQGKAYITKTGKIIEERKCTPLNPCRKNCKDKLTYEYQKLLFNTYWSLKSYNQRLMYISSLIEIVEKASQTLNKNLTNPRNRQNTVLYYIESNGTKINICKNCFIFTFGETESFIRTVKMKKLSCNSNLLRDNRGKAVPRHKLSDEKYESIKNHIINFPPFEINNRKCLSPVKYSRSKLSISKMHQLYCQKNEAVSLSVYTKIFNNLNYKFKRDPCRALKQ